eukprot:6975549-Prymnesium_polylepis.1
MGATQSKAEQLRLLVIGRASSGKSSVVQRLLAGNGNALPTILPTQNFNLEEVERGGYHLQLWDVGWNIPGSPEHAYQRLGIFGRHYMPNTQALVLTVDSTDVDNMPALRDDLQELLDQYQEHLHDSLILVMANKQDLPNALDAAAIAAHLGLHALRRRAWHIQPCSALTGDGVGEGFDWLVSRSLDEWQQLLTRAAPVGAVG